MSIEFEQLADLWLESGCHQNPSALHGWLTGYLAAGGRLASAQWLSEAQDYLELDDELPSKLHHVLLPLYEQVLNGLNAESMEFQPLLPGDDEADVDEQVESLAQWSKGFLDGFGAAGRIQGKLPEEVAEVLQDLDAFSQAELDDPKDPQNELLYLELAEHARIAALTVFYAMNQNPPSPKQLH